jgi:hypothetical protein
MNTIPYDGMNHPAEGLTARLAAHLRVDCKDMPWRCSLLDLIREEGNSKNVEVEGNTTVVAKSLVRISDSQQVNHFIFIDHSRLLELPNPAPPPKLHHSTWWKSVTRRVYRSNASSRLKKFKAGMQSHAMAFQN